MNDFRKIGGKHTYEAVAGRNLLVIVGNPRDNVSFWRLENPGAPEEGRIDIEYRLGKHLEAQCYGKPDVLRLYKEAIRSSETLPAEFKRVLTSI